MSEYLHSDQFIQQFLNGEAAAFHAVYDHFFGDIYKFSLSLVDDKEAAKDITSDTLLKLFIKHKDFDSYKNLRAFLYVASRNECMNHFRYLKKVREGNASILKASKGDATNLDDQLDGMYHNTLNQSVKILIEKLPEKQQQAIRFIFFEDLTLKETAQKMDLSVSGVKFIKKTAINRMAEVIGSSSLAEVLSLISSFAYIMLEFGAALAHKIFI